MMSRHVSVGVEDIDRPYYPRAFEERTQDRENEKGKAGDNQLAFENGGHFFQIIPRAPATGGRGSDSSRRANVHRTRLL